MVTYNVNESHPRQILVHKDSYCGDLLIDIEEYAKKRIEMGDTGRYQKIAKLLESDAKILIFQMHSDCGVTSSIGIAPFFVDSVFAYHGGRMEECRATSSYFLAYETDMKDAKRRPIYKDVTGKPFVFDYYNGSPEYFPRCRVVHPE